jgi:hypothetical protein
MLRLNRGKVRKKRERKGTGKTEERGKEKG